jgi:WD40 repeat protein
VARFSPSGNWVASGDIAGKVRVWAYDHEEKVLKIEVQPFAGEIKDICWDPENKRIVAVGDGAGIKAKCFMWDTGNSVSGWGVCACPFLWLRCRNGAYCVCEKKNRSHHSYDPTPPNVTMLQTSSHQ